MSDLMTLDQVIWETIAGRSSVWDSRLNTQPVKSITRRMRYIMRSGLNYLSIEHTLGLEDNGCDLESWIYRLCITVLTVSLCMTSCIWSVLNLYISYPSLSSSSSPHGTI